MNFKGLFRTAILCGLLSIASSQVAFSATYFIDYATGSDANTGTSTGSAWKHCPGDTTATGNAASLIPRPGDTIVFKGGVRYGFASGTGNRFISIKSSGTATAPISYLSGHLYSTPWPSSTSRAVIDGAYSRGLGSNSSGVMGISNKQYITIKGFEMVNQPNAGADYGFVGITGNTWRNITIDSCEMHYTNGSAVFAGGMWDPGTPPSYLTIQNCKFYDSWGHLLHLAYGMDRTLIQNNSFDRHGSNPYGQGNVGANAIAFSYTADPWNTQRNTNTTVRGNDFNQSLNPATKSHILLQHILENLVIEKNTFRGTPSVSAIDQVGPLLNFTLRNNVFSDHTTWLEGILRFYTDQGNGIYCDGIKIYNNTFVATPALQSVIYFVKGNNSSNTDVYRNVDIRNNIIDTDSNNKNLIHIGPNYTGNGPVVNLATFTCDYNVYNAGTNATPFSYLNTRYSLSNWISKIGGDTNSTMGAVSFTNRAGLDFTLSASDTKAKGRGTDLSATGFSDDKTGKGRGSVWDLGAYQISGSTVQILAAPTLLSVR